MCFTHSTKRYGSIHATATNFLCSELTASARRTPAPSASSRDAARGKGRYIRGVHRAIDFVRRLRCRPVAHVSDLGLVPCEYSNQLIAKAQVMQLRGPERTN
jgi:hypothetical protein